MYRVIASHVHDIRLDLFNTSRMMVEFVYRVKNEVAPIVFALCTASGVTLGNTLALLAFEMGFKNVTNQHTLMVGNLLLIIRGHPKTRKKVQHNSKPPLQEMFLTCFCTW